MHLLGRCCTLVTWLSDTVQYYQYGRLVVHIYLAICLGTYFNIWCPTVQQVFFYSQVFGGSSSIYLVQTK